MSFDADKLTLSERIHLILTQSWPPGEHPGNLLIKVAKEADLSLNQLALALKVSPNTIYQICRHERAISPEMALRLSFLFNVRAMDWLTLQARHDLQVAEKTVDLKGVEEFDEEKWKARSVLKMGPKKTRPYVQRTERWSRPRTRK